MAEAVPTFAHGPVPLARASAMLLVEPAIRLIGRPAPFFRDKQTCRRHQATMFDLRIDDKVTWHLDVYRERPRS